MCLLAMAWGLHPRYPLLLAANRDEFHARPSTAMQWWDDGHTLAGRDLQAGGTWLGMGRSGRIGVLTNVREPTAPVQGLASRGGLVPRWLGALKSAEQFEAELSAIHTNGFNLLALDARTGEAHCWSNRHAHQRRLPPGLYGLSNAALDTPWPKLQRLKRHVQQAVEPGSAPEPEGHTPEGLIEWLLAGLVDRHQPPDEALPRTGLPLEWERPLSRVFIETPDGRYGTRCSTVIVVEQLPQGHQRLHVREQGWDAQGQATTQVEHRFDIHR